MVCAFYGNYWEINLSVNQTSENTHLVVFIEELRNGLAELHITCRNQKELILLRHSDKKLR